MPVNFSVPVGPKTLDREYTPNRSLFRAAGWRRSASTLGVAVLLALAPLSTDAREAANQTGGLYEEALRRFEDKDYRGAIIQLKNVLQTNPENLPARILIGRSHLALGDALAAEKELRRAKVEGGDEELLAVPLASALLLMKRYEDILFTLPVEGRSPDVEYGLQITHGQAHLGLRQISQAEEAFGRARQLKPKTAMPYVGLARVSLERAEFLDARDAATKATQLEPENFYVWFIHGRVARRLGNLPMALSNLDKAAALGPEHTPTRVARAMALIQVGRYADAEKDLAVLSERLPNSPHTAYIDAHVKLHQGDAVGYDHALQKANTQLRGLEREELFGTPNLLLLAGIVNYALKNYNDAYNFLREHVARDRFHPGSRSLLSRLMMRRGEVRNALTMIQTAVDLAPENPEFQLWLGAVQMRNERTEEATEAFKKAIALRPKAIRPRTDLARGYIQMGRTEDAIEVLQSTFGMRQDTVEPGIMLGLLQLKEGQYDAVIEISKKLLERAPENPAGYNLLASAQWSKGDEKAARSNLEKAIEVDPTYLSAHRNLASIDLKTGNIEAAKKRYRDMLEMPEAGVQPLIDLAKIAAQEDDLRESISLLSKARDQAPDRISVELDLISLLARSGDGDSAIRNARKLYERFPDSVAVMEKLGHMEQAYGKTDEASKIFRRVAEEFGENADQLLRVAGYQIGANDLTGAHGTLKRAHTADDKHLKVLESLIELESRMERYDDALLRARLLAKQTPDKAIGHRLRGDVLVRLRKFKDAAAVYTEAVQKERTGYLLVRRYIAQRAAGTAAPLKPLEAWVAKNPEDYGTRRTLASAYIDTGQKQKAVKLYEELTAIRENDPVVLNNLANLYADLGDDRALEVAEAAHRLAPKQPQTLDTLGWLLVKKGELERGLELLRDAFARASRRPRVRYHLAVALSRQGKAAEAREHLQAILESETLSDELADKSRRLLATLRDG